MVYVNFDQFDDELQRLQELLDEGHIALADKSLLVPIESLHLKNAVTVPVGTPVKDCINTMVARHFGCLLVVDKKKLTGIFTERDVLTKIAGKALNLAQEKIENFMSPNPISFRVTDTIETVLRQMHEGGYRHVAIVGEDDIPLSVLSVKDIVSYIVEFFPQDILNLPPHPIRVGTKNRYGA